MDSHSQEHARDLLILLTTATAVAIETFVGTVREGQNYIMLAMVEGEVGEGERGRREGDEGIKVNTTGGGEDKKRQGKGEREGGGK